MAGKVCYLAFSFEYCKATKMAAPFSSQDRLMLQGLKRLGKKTDG